MASIAADPNLQDLNQKDKQPSDSQASAQPINISGTSASNTSTVTAGGATPATPAATSSGRFQNLQGYLQANKGYGGDSGFAGQVGSSLADLEQRQEKDISDETGRVKSEAEQQAAPFQKDAMGTYAQNVFKDPNAFVQGQGNLDQWSRYYSGQYQAPHGYDESQQLANQQQQFQQMAGLTGTESGRTALLQRLYGTPGYSIGQRSLDNLLLQSQPGQLTQLQQQAGQLSTQLGQAYGTGQQQSRAALDALATNADTGSKYLQSLLGTPDAAGNYGGYIGAEEQKLLDRAAAAQMQRQTELSNVVTSAAQNKLPSETLQELGLQSGMSIYTADPSKYIQNQAGTVHVGNISTAADEAKFKALAQLAGQPAQSALGHWADVTGQLDKPYNFDMAKFIGDINAAKGHYQDEMQNLVVPVSTTSGQVFPTKLSDLRQEIASSQHDLDIGANPDAAKTFLKFAIPALQAAEADLASKYQINRKLNTGVLPLVAASRTNYPGQTKSPR